ncbi:MAG: glucose-6-phosphate dehydrogenase [Phycisphaerae bacterium]
MPPVAPPAVLPTLDNSRAQPCVVVIFGATGDLTQRKLLPALYNLSREGLLGEGTTVVGFARRPKTDDEFRTEMRAAVQQFARRQPFDAAGWDRLASRVFYHQANFDDPAGYTALAERLAALEKDGPTAGRRLYYLSTAPTEFGTIVDNLGNAGLGNIDPFRPAAWRRLIIEKPFGRDQATALELNTRTAHVFDESQVFRIDHYLGKQTVQNLLVFRFANGIFEPLWNRNHIDHVQITVGETLGVESRGGYFETAGTLRDMLQNHLMQLLTLVAMEPPVALEADAIRDEKVKVLRSMERLTPQEAARRTVRGQYIGGMIAGQAVNGYRQEKGVSPESPIETFAAVKLHINNWRWAGVPFYLRSGKRLAKQGSEICIHFNRAPGVLFNAPSAPSSKKDGECPPPPPANRVNANVLILRVQPNEGISLLMNAKTPGNHTKIAPASMDFDYDVAFGSYSPEAYERLLLDAIQGDSTLFIRRDEVESAWGIIDSIEAAWARGMPSLSFYAPGTWGPEQADTLMEREGRRWDTLISTSAKELAVETTAT